MTTTVCNQLLNFLLHMVGGRGFHISIQQYYLTFFNPNIDWRIGRKININIFLSNSKAFLQISLGKSAETSWNYVLD